MLRHLYAEPGEDGFHFLVNEKRSPTGVGLHAVDIDADDPGAADSLAQELATSDLFKGVDTWIEPSRNRSGRYVWFVLERSARAHDLNKLLNEASALLLPAEPPSNLPGDDAALGGSGIRVIELKAAAIVMSGAPGWRRSWERRQKGVLLFVLASGEAAGLDVTVCPLSTGHA
jgi:hypothetical protein